MKVQITRRRQRRGSWHQTRPMTRKRLAQEGKSRAEEQNDDSANHEKATKERLLVSNAASDEDKTEAEEGTSRAEEQNDESANHEKATKERLLASNAANDEDKTEAEEGNSRAEEQNDDS